MQPILTEQFPVLGSSRWRSAMPHDAHTLRGWLRVRLRDKRGRVLHEALLANAIVDTGRVLIGQLLVGDAFER